MEKKDVFKYLQGFAIGALGAGAVAGWVCKKPFNGKKKVINFDELEKNYEKDHQTNEELEKLMQEQLVRNYQYFGKKGQDLVRKSFVVVVGVGGVGSHVANALARSGVERIRVIDFDLVSVSSLNRSAFAFRGDVGKPKVRIVEDYIKTLNPLGKVEAKYCLFKEDNQEELLSGNPDFVVDCIDDITTKVQLLKYGIEKNLRVISSGGAGMKADPSRIQIRDITDTSYDSLSKAVRNKLKELGVVGKIPVVFSNETPEKELLPLNETQKENPEDYRALDNFRVRIVPVLGTMPSIFGQSIAAFVLGSLANQPLNCSKYDDTKFNIYHKMMVRVENIGNKEKLDKDFDIEDVIFAAREVCEWMGVATERRVSSLQLSIWDKSKKVDGTNLILLCEKLTKMAKDGKNIEEMKKIFTSEELSRVEAALKRAEQQYKRKNLIYVAYDGK